MSWKQVPWWIRFLLWFKRSQYSVDFGWPDMNCGIRWKHLFGKIYILNEEHWEGKP